MAETFIVTQGGRACGLYNAAKQRRGGVLIPASEELPVVGFVKRRDARRAINRTKRIAESLQGSLVDDWIKLSPILSGQPYDILPLVPSHQ